MRTVAVLTKNKYLYRKLTLLFEEAGLSVTGPAEAEICVVDIDTENSSGDVTVSYRKDSGADILMPASFAQIKAAISREKGGFLHTDAVWRLVFLGGEAVKLTEIEFSLFSLLFEKKSFVSREEILSEVWSGKADGGVINVYIHYLRQKLEKHGEKIIISSRKDGYRIAEKYLESSAYHDYDGKESAVYDN